MGKSLSTVDEFSVLSWKEVEMGREGWFVEFGRGGWFIEGGLTELGSDGCDTVSGDWETSLEGGNMEDIGSGLGRDGG